MGKNLAMKEYDNRAGGFSYINLVLVIALVFVLAAMLKPFFIGSKKTESVSVKPKKLPMVDTRSVRQVYDIDKVKKSVSQTVQPDKKFSDLKEMYKNCNKRNVGGNMVESWARVKPEDKSKVSEGFDKQIVIAQKALKENPSDKHAKNMLRISEMLKKMSADGFNYKFKDKK